MGKILILANSSDGLYDFRNELVEKLLEKEQVVASLPDHVKTKELLKAAKTLPNEQLDILVKLVKDLKK